LVHNHRKSAQVLGDIILSVHILHYCIILRRSLKGIYMIIQKLWH